MKCPNCRHEQPDGMPECQGCSVNFEKLRLKEARQQGLAPSLAVTSMVSSDAISTGPAAIAADAEAPETKVFKDAAAAGGACAVLTAIAIIISVTGVYNLGMDAWGFLDVAAILGLSYGVSRKSPACAVVLFVYYVGCKIAAVASPPHRSPGYMSFYFAYVFGKAAMTLFR